MDNNLKSKITNKARSKLYLFLAALIQITSGVFFLIFHVENVKIHLYFLAGILLVCGCLYLASFLVDQKAHYRPGYVLPMGIVCLVGIMNLLIKESEESVRIIDTIGMIFLFVGMVLLASGVQYRFLEIDKWWFNIVNAVVFISFGAILYMTSIIKPEHYNIVAAVSMFCFAFATLLEFVIYYKKNGGHNGQSYRRKS